MLALPARNEMKKKQNAGKIKNGTKGDYEGKTVNFRSRSFLVRSVVCDRRSKAKPSHS